MAAYSRQMIEYHKQRVREVMALIPGATTTRICEALKSNKKNPLELDYKYVSKLKCKIEVERIHYLDRKIIGVRLSELQDRFEMVMTNSWSILLDPNQQAGDRIRAGKLIIEADKMLLDAQMDAGIYERKLGTLDAGGGLTDIERQSIATIFENFKLVAKPREVKQLDAPNPNDTTNSPAGTS